MESEPCQKGADLHLRAVFGGEPLNGSEQAAYTAWCHALDADEALDGSLDRMRQLLAQIRAVESHRRELQVRGTELDARIAALEARLDIQSRQDRTLRG